MAHGLSTGTGTVPVTMQTSTGAYFDFLNPENHWYDIEEIAHHLSNICRYTGAVRSHYSVAQHSVMCSLIVPPKYAMDALMHDASEAYLGDVSSPLKALLPKYKELERQVEAAIALQYGLEFPLPAVVKQADLTMLMTEKRDLMPATDEDHRHWCNVPPLDMYKIIPMNAEAAKELFMLRYQELEKGRNGRRTNS